MNVQCDESSFGEEEMHTAPHPTLGEIEASLLGSKGLFHKEDIVYEELDSMVPWTCPKPTPLAVFKSVRAWRSVCSSPNNTSSLPFSFPCGGHPVQTKPIPLSHTKRKLSPNCKKAANISASPTLIPTKRKSPNVQRKVSNGGKTEIKLKSMHRPSIQLRANHLKLLAVQRLERPLKVQVCSVDISQNKTLSRISDRTMSASTFAESYRGSFSKKGV